MDGTLDFAIYKWGSVLNSDNATQTHLIFVKLLGMLKVNFYIVNALGQN